MLTCLHHLSFIVKWKGKMMKTLFPQNYVYVLRTTTTRHMVSFIDFYFHFLANFKTETSPHMFSIFTYIMSRVTHSEPGLLMIWMQFIFAAERKFMSFALLNLLVIQRSILTSFKRGWRTRQANCMQSKPPAELYGKWDC